MGGCKAAYDPFPLLPRRQSSCPQSCSPLACSGAKTLHRETLKQRSVVGRNESGVVEKVLKINESSHGNRKTPRSPPVRMKKIFLLLYYYYYFFCPFSRWTYSRIPGYIINLTKSSPTAFSLDVPSHSYKNQPSTMVAWWAEVRGRMYNVYILYIYCILYIQKNVLCLIFIRRGLQMTSPVPLLYLLPYPRKGG